MKRRLLALATAAIVASADAAPAIDLGFGLLKKRQEKKDPPKGDTAATEKQHVATLQSDRDEGNRKAAAAALRGADPKANFDIVTALSAAVLKDPSPDVRATAAESLGSLKVMYQQAVTALEKAEADDPDQDVRATAKAALFQYSLGGYKPLGSVAKSQSAEPPLAKPSRSPLPVATPPTTVTVAKPSAPAVPFRTITQGPGSTSAYTPSAEPPLAVPTSKPAAKPQPTATPTLAPPLAVPQRMPAAVPQQMPTTVEPPKAEAPIVPPPTSPRPLQSLPTLPQVKPVPTVMPPPK